MLAIKTSVNSSSLMKQTGRKYCTTKSIPTIMDKKISMNQIRTIIAKSIKPLDPEKKKRYFVCVTHTYPAWKKIFTLFSSINSIISALKKESHSAQNPYGHALVDFFDVDTTDKNSTNTDTVVNVGVALQKNSNESCPEDFLHFFPSEKYFFNNNDENSMVVGNNQGGILERSFLSLAYEIDNETWSQMQKYYANIKEQTMINNSYKFSLGIHLFLNPLKKIANYLVQIMEKKVDFNVSYPLLFEPHITVYNLLVKIASIPERGNCCYWTSKGFKKVKMIDTHSNFPMLFFYKIFINLLFRKAKYFINISKEPLDYSVIFYRGLKHTEMPNGSFIYPFYWFRYGYEIIWKPEKMANIEVTVVPTENKNSSVYKIDITEIPKEKVNNIVTTTIAYVKKVLKIV